MFKAELQNITRFGSTTNFLTEEEFHNPHIKSRADRDNEQYGIDFTPNDINYIIVDKEDEILDIMHEVRQIKKPHYSIKDVNLLTTRIISMNRILEDF